MVVPGLADVVVRAPASDIKTVRVRPVFLRVGVAGAPSGDVAKPAPGESSTYAAQLWLMRSGAYSVYVTIDGARGSGTAVVPVMSVATGRLGVSRGLATMLVLLGVMLIAGLITIIHAGAGDSLVPAGNRTPPSLRRRANLVTVGSVPVLALLLLGAARWWKAVDRDYKRTMFNPPALAASTETIGDRTVLTLSTRDTSEDRTRLSALIPDHGKMMHLFLVGTSSTTLAHLHPVPVDDATFRVNVPPVPGGKYRAFADVTTEQGSTVTLSGSVVVPIVPARSTPEDPDDAWVADRRAAPIVGGVDTLARGLLMRWAGSSAALATGRETDLRFTVHDSGGAVVDLQPYLGMAGHAVVTADDGSVFIHLHPMGTVSPAVQRLFALRDRGDTMASGRLRLEDSSALPTAATMNQMPMRGELSFPYEFPKPGRYHVWVQVKRNGRVLTGVYMADVR
jgi:hypothetical protein